MPESQNRVEFTVILYGIVASIALFRLPYDITLRSGMLLFALFILAADWIEYQLTTYEVPNTVDNIIVQFGVDILILVVWTYLTTVPQSDVPVFTSVVVVFVLLQGAWELLLYQNPHTGLIIQTELELGVVLGLLLAIQFIVTLANIVLFVLTAGLFIAWKSSLWKSLYAEAKQSDGTPVI